MAVLLNNQIYYIFHRRFALTTQFSHRYRGVHRYPFQLNYGLVAAQVLRQTSRNSRGWRVDIGTVTHVRGYAGKGGDCTLDITFALCEGQL